MRKRFDQGIELGRLLISDTPVFQKSRHEVVAMTIAIYNNNEYSNKIFNTLEDKLIKGKKKTGRPGLNLWQIFVLAQLRLVSNIDYDHLHYMVLTDSSLYF